MTYSQPLLIIVLPGSEQRLERVVGWERKAGSVDEELAGDVEEDEEEVEGAEAEHEVDFGDARLLLELVEVRLLGELLVLQGEWRVSHGADALSLGPWCLTSWLRWYCALHKRSVPVP